MFAKFIKKGSRDNKKVTNPCAYDTYNLLFEALVDFLLVVGELLDDHGLPVQSQGPVLVELLL